MKRLLILILLLNSSFLLSAQNSQNESIIFKILNVPDYRTSSLNLNPTTSNSIVSYKELQFKGNGLNKYEIDTKIKYTLSNDRITTIKKVLLPTDFTPRIEANLTFAYKNNLVDIKKVEGTNTDRYTYQYNHNNRLKKITVTSSGFVFYYDFIYSNKEILITESNLFKKLGVYKVTMDYQNKILNISDTSLISENIKRHSYQYYNNKISSKYFSFPSSSKVAGNNTVSTIYSYNSDNLLNYSDQSSTSSGMTTSKSSYYKYKLDLNKNWVIKQINKTSKASVFYPTFDLREITYSNGVVTGSVDFDSQSVQNVIQTNGYTYFKISKKRSTIISKSNFEIKKKSTFGKNQEHLIAMDSKNKELLFFKNAIKNDSLNFYNADEVFKCDYGFWYKINDNAILYDSNLKQIKDYENIILTEDGMHAIYNRKNSSTKYFLRNFSNTNKFKINTIELYDGKEVTSYSINNLPKNDIKKSIKACYKRNENSYWLYINDEVRSGTKSYWAGNDLVLYEPKSEKTFLFDNYKNAEYNVEKEAIELNPMVYTYWYKNAAGNFFVYQKGALFKMSKNTWSTENKNDLIIYGLNGVKAYLLKGYKNIPADKIQSVTKINEAYLTEKEKNIPFGCTGDCTKGKASYAWDDGSYYIGDFKDWKYHGNGYYKFVNGSSYEGEWIDGVENGNGTLIFGNHSIYKGEKYIGDFVKGKYEGYGEYYFKDGRYYKGYWKNGKYEGEGVHKLSLGVKHVGNFKDGKREGKGTEYYADGRVKQNGIWTNDNFTRTSNEIPLKEATFINISKNNTINNTTSNISRYDFESYKDNLSAYVEHIFDPKIDEYLKTLDEESVHKKYADYLTAFNNQFPGKAFNLLMKSRHADVYSSSRKYFPSGFTEKIKNEANSVMKGYNKHINSKETKDAIKKHGGSFK